MNTPPTKTSSAIPFIFYPAPVKTTSPFLLQEASFPEFYLKLKPFALSANREAMDHPKTLLRQLRAILCACKTSVEVARGRFELPSKAPKASMIAATPPG